MLSGHCLCGAVRIEIDGMASPPTICHCGMCRRWHGAMGAYTSAEAGAGRMTGEENVRVYRSSSDAERGFCGICGSKLFWRELGSASIDPALGLFDQPTGLSVRAHIWVAHKGDYYRIGDGVPCYAESAANAQPIPEPALPARAEIGVHRGRCLCGSVSYQLKGRVRDIVTCHCGMCRRWHGHFAAYTASLRSDIELSGESDLRWFNSSEGARRGFCGECGSSLFWASEGRDRWSVAAGTLEPPTGLLNTRHIFTADKGDCYQIADDVRQMPGSMAADPVPF